MPYIGNQPAEQFTSFATQTFSVSATTSYTLDHAVTNENEIALFVNNVRQQPGSGKAYTATGTALTLSAATASTDTMYCVFLGRALQTVNPATNSITAAMVSNDLISGKDALTSTPASTDELLISDAGVLKRIDFSLIGGKNTPAWFVTKSSNQSTSTGTHTDVSFDTEEIDTDGAFSTPSFTVPSGAAGKYFAFGTVRFQTSTDFSYAICRIVHNSTNVVSGWDRNDDYTSIHAQCMVTLAEGDTLKLQARQQSGGDLNIGANDSGHVTYFGGYKIIE